MARSSVEHPEKQGKEAGAVSIIAAFAIFSLLAVTALVIDIGLLYQERRQLQTAVDAAALAGAIDLAEGKGPEQAQAAAQLYVLQNSNVAPNQVSVDFPEANEISVTGTTTRNLMIAPIFGRKNSQVKASASAGFGPATSVQNLVPIIVPIEQVASHTGAGNIANFELGEDRPKEAFTKTAQIEGDRIKYIINYINSGNSAEDITITDPLSENATYVEGSATNGGIYNSETRTLTWTFANIAPGDNRTVSFYVQAPDVNNTAYLKTSSSSKTITAGVSGNNPQRGFFWLCDFNAGSGGTPDLDSWIRSGYPEDVSVGFVANGEGVRASLNEALSARQQSDPRVVLPLYNFTEEGGSPGKYHVVGFAEFMITGFDLHGQPKAVSGYFTTGTVTAGSSDGILPTDDFGVTVVWLTS